MTLIETLPQPVEEQLAADDRPLITIATDLTIQGVFGEEWLVITGDRLLVYPEHPGQPGDRLNGGERQSIAALVPRLDLPLAAIRSPRAEVLVGGAALQATVDGRTIDLVRYTNARRRAFGRVAKYLGELASFNEAQARGEAAPAPQLADDPEEERRCPTCRLPLLEGTRVCPACMDKGQVIARLLGYLRPYWKQTAWISALMLAGTALGLVAPYLTRPLMDVVLVPTGAPLPIEQRGFWLVVIVLGMLATRLASQVLGIAQGRGASWLSHQLAHNLRVELYEHLQRQSLRYFDKRQTGALMARVTEDTESLESVLTTSAQHLIANLLTLAGIGIVLAVVDWRLMVLSLLPAPVVVALSRLFWRRIRGVWRRWWHLREQLCAVLNDSLSGVRVVKAFAQEQFEIARFRPASGDLAQARLAAEQLSNTVFPLLSFVTSTGTLIVWYVGGRQVLGDGATLGTLLTFIAYLGMFYGPLQILSRTPEWLSRALASAERIFEVLDSEPEVAETPGATQLPRIAGRVQFANVTFGYDAHQTALKNVSFEVAPGEMIGLVGHSGAGKSTTINLLCRFYDVHEGQILIDGVDIRQIRQQDLRSQIGVVLQDTFLFNGTIAENIGYARPGATREEIMAAAGAANAHGFIVQKPDGYDTQVGERGQSLSGGERQRIAIARAILHNPRILILDEATSAVDTDTEKQIQEALARLVKGRTTFAIAHRLSTLRNADRLLVLKDGAIQESGTHDELLAQRGEFHRLVEMQQELSKIHVVTG